MKTTKAILLASVLSLTLGGIACSHLDAKPIVAAENVAPAPLGFAHETSALTPDPAIVYGMLPNGLHYAVLPNGTPSETAVLWVRIGSGSLNETDRQRGAAHFLEHMAFNGSKNIPEGQMVKRLERFGLSFGGHTNAYTTFGETVYMLNLPNVSEELIDETFFIMRETASNLSLLPGAVNRERGVIQSEKRNSDNVGTRADLATMAFMTQNARVMARMPIGDDETLKQLTPNDLRTYYEAYYRPENAFVMFVGDANSKEVIEKINKYFGDWKGVGAPGEVHGEGSVTERDMEIGYFSDPGISTSISIAKLHPYIPRHDDAQTRKNDYLDRIGNSILNQRLSDLAQMENAPFISARAGGTTNLKTSNGVRLDLDSSAENWAKALAFGEQELRKAIEFGFTQKELDEQILNKTKSMKRAAQIADTRQTGVLMGMLNASYGQDYVATHPQSELDAYLGYKDEITVQDVWNRFNTQWAGLDKPLLFLKSAKALENPKEEIRKAYTDSRKVAVSANVKEEKLSEFAYTYFGTPGKVVEQSYIKDIDTHLIRFENNVLLNFKQTDFKKDSIHISASIGDGLLSLPRKDAALVSLAETMLGAGGLEAHSQREIGSLMAGKSVSVSFAFHDKDFVLGGTTNNTDLSDQLNMLTATVIAPGYDKVLYQRYQQYMQSWYPTIASTPEGVGSRDVERLLHGGDPRFGMAPIERVLAANVDEVRNWVSPQLQSGQIEISVVGDVDKDTIIAQIARTFGALPKRDLGHKSYPDMLSVSFPKWQKDPVTLVHEGDANRASLQVYWKAPDANDPTRERRLGIVASLLGNRLLSVIREDKGAAYSPRGGRAGSKIFKDYGFIVANLGLVPEQVSEMIKVVDEIAADLKAGNVTQDEFNRALQPTLGGLDRFLENNSFWMDVIAYAQTDTTDIKDFRTREQDYTDMTLDDLKPLMAEIFNDKNAYRIQILPKTK